MNSKKKIFALGFFDGVHLGHQALLKRACALAERLGATPVAITFDAHPMRLRGGQIPPLLTDVPAREMLLKQFGMEEILVLSVTDDVMSTSWQDFLEMRLADGAVGFVCGDDFRFGNRGEGDATRLRQFCATRGIACEVVPEQTLEGRRISSSYIRTQIACGDMATAVRFLGHPHILCGEVVHGKQLGQTIGVPTANLRLSEGVICPKFGVYICKCTLGGKTYPAVTNVGTRPTVHGEGVTVEPWLIGYEGDLYGAQITLEFLHFLRAEEKFPSLDALRAQICRDREATEAFFADIHGKFAIS